MTDERKQIGEMLGEFLREAAVLIFVFVPLDYLLVGRLSRELFAGALVVATLALIGGIGLERTRS